MNFIKFSIILAALTAYSQLGQAKGPAKVQAVTYLTSDGLSDAPIYQIRIRGEKAVLIESIPARCNIGQACPPPSETSNIAVQFKIEEDQIPKDGPKRINLGHGYFLNISYKWGTSEKQYFLLLPQGTSEDVQRKVKLTLTFDVIDSKK